MNWMSGSQWKAVRFQRTQNLEEAACASTTALMLCRMLTEVAAVLREVLGATPELVPYSSRRTVRALHITATASPLLMHRAHTFDIM
jgi:hypothetical protein